MRCPECGLDTIEGASFCNYCGVPLHSLCTKCNTPNPLGSRFCSSCGSALASGLPQASPTARVSPPRMPESGRSAICPRCKNVNELGAIYCFSCGLPLDDTSALSPHDAPPYRANRTPSRTKVVSIPRNEPAGFWIRLVADLIDFVIVLILFGIIGAFIPALADMVDSESRWISVVIYLIGAPYHIIGWSIWSTTLGKRALSLYVVDLNGFKPSLMEAIGRYLGYIASSFLLGIGFIVIGLRKDKRGWHDRFSGTSVIRRR